MKTVTFTDEEVKMVRGCADYIREIGDSQLRNCNYSSPDTKENAIQEVCIAESILKKLGE